MVAERVLENSQHPSTPVEYPEILDEQILAQNGSFKRVKRYLRGWHPDLPNARLHMGWQGRETIVEKDVITPIKTFTITEATRTYRGLETSTRQPYLHIVKVTT